MSLKRLLVANDGGVWGEDFDTDGVPVLRSTDMSIDGSWQVTDPAVRRLSPSEIASSRLLRDDIVITKSSGSQLHLGKSAIVTHAVESTGACFSNFMQRIRANASLYPKYLWWLLNSEFAREQLFFNGSTTTGLVNLSGKIIGNTVVTQPTIDEQRAIAAFLDRETARIDALVAKKQRLIELLEEKRRAIISQAVTKGLQHEEACRPSKLFWLESFPGNWTMTRLKYVAEIQTGLTLGKNYGDRELVERPYLRVANVQDGYLDLADITNVSVPADDVARHELQAGDVLMTEGGDFDKLGRGFVWEAQIPGCLHQNHVFAVRPKQDFLLPHYLAALMTSAHGKIYFTYTSQQSTNLASTNSTKLGNFPIPLPSVERQKSILQSIAERSGTINKCVKRIHCGISSLTEYRSALISAAVTGQIDVREEVQLEA
jgi:type I restriction enzyme S subunit